MHLPNLNCMHLVGVSDKTVEIEFLIWPKNKKYLREKRLLHTHTHVVAVEQPLSRVWLFATPWTTARQTSLSFMMAQSLLKLPTDTWLHLNSTGMDTIPFIAKEKHRRGPQPISRAATEQFWEGAFMSIPYLLLTFLINCTRWTEILSVSLAIKIVWCAVCSEKLGNLSQIEIDSLVILKEARDLPTVPLGRKS